MRQALDRMQRYSDKLVEDPAVTFDEFFAQGLQLVRSKEAQEAFDIHRETDAIRDSYGRNDFGHRLLLARRLISVGVSFVTIQYGGWDHHTKIFESYRGNSMKNLDQGLSGLITDSSRWRHLIGCICPREARHR